MQFNIEKFHRYLDGFKTYIESNSNTCENDLTRTSFFQDQEGYKHTAYSNAQNALDFDNWSPFDIGTGMIAQKAIKAVDEASNLVHHQQKIHFKNKIKKDLKKAESLLYNLYCLNDDEKAFDAMVAFWGGKYDLIAYLFFIKNDRKYLPISPSNFDERFEMLNLPLRMARNCSSQNYFSFIYYIDELRKCISAYYGFEISLLDAHSIIWQLSAASKYVAQIEERNADAILTQEINLLPQNEFEPTGYTGKPTERTNPIISNDHKIYPRNRLTALNALQIAKHCCEINPSHESFIRKKSNVKYMEPHHLVPMCESENFCVSLDKEEIYFPCHKNCQLFSFQKYYNCNRFYQAYI